ncbi:hypothetical protein ACEWY4_017990 [Coilia grayii]|uniref:Crystaline entomocidal protoxin n=1 Tax=Coilia grayii TaxID=363190 RepID=A0ABD1JL99_9TELE
MSSTLSPSDRERLAAEFFRQIPPNYADVGINESLLMFSGKDSLTRLEVLSSKLPAHVKEIGGVLKGFTPVPNAVGLGAYLIATFLEYYAWGKESSLKSILGSILEEEKASEVWNLMEEYLKRYEMHLWNDGTLLKETQRLERQLSLQLTRLRNFMDKQINSRAVKRWVNGATFHVQMLIQIARLSKSTGQGTQAFEGAKKAASRAVITYRNDWIKIQNKYREFKTSALTISERCSYTTGRCPAPPPPPGCRFEESEIKFHCFISYHTKMSPGYYVDYIFENHKQLKEINDYFSNLEKNIDDLASQTGDFQIKH